MTFYTTIVFQAVMILVPIGVILFFVLKPVKSRVANTSTPIVPNPISSDQSTATEASISSLFMRVAVTAILLFLTCAAWKALASGWIGVVPGTEQEAQFFAIFIGGPMVVLITPIFIISLLKTIKFYRNNK